MPVTSRSWSQNSMTSFGLLPGLHRCRSWTSQGVNSYTSLEVPF